MQTKANRKGFTLVEIMIVVAIIGLLAAIAIPNFVKARTNSQTNACINNLRVIDAAVQQWALEKGKGPSDVPATDGSDIKGYLGRGSSGSLPYCPLDTSKAYNASYTVATVATAPTCQKDATNHVLPTGN
jgi:prepilin-type N-terminal cleavage/methylation domain-containing protein